VAVKRIERELGLTIRSERIKGRMSWTVELKKPEGEPAPSPERPIELY